MSEDSAAAGRYRLTLSERGYELISPDAPSYTARQQIEEYAERYERIRDRGAVSALAPAIAGEVERYVAMAAQMLGGR